MILTLIMLQACFLMNWSIADMRKLFRNDNTLQLLLPNVSKLLQIFLTLPCSSCEAERSFSCLRRLKTYLRSTMSQTRLNHVAVLNIHKEDLDGLTKTQVINDWILKTSARKNTLALKK